MKIFKNVCFVATILFPMSVLILLGIICGQIRNVWYMYWKWLIKD